ncbi:MAG: hypothetical protein KKG02_10810 [Candidatus Edwardsbacteria bacterium]|nr:hypothetical protein [Candidatus Edwardsbacteria bacterium]
MARTIDFLTNFPTKNDIDNTTLKKFIVALEYIIGFSPDRSENTWSDEVRHKIFSYFGDIAVIESDIEQSFLSDLYVDLFDKQEITNYLPSKRPLALTGYVGMGKTVLLKKIESDINSESILFIYIDFKAIHVEFEGQPKDQYNNILTNLLYINIYNSFITDKVFEKWKHFLVLNDPGYLPIKETIMAFFNKTNISEVELQEALKNDVINDIYLKCNNNRPLLTTLIKFLKQYTFIILCFDNVDKQCLFTQKLILSKSIDLSNSSEIPIIVSIRRLLNFIREEGRDGDLLFEHRISLASISKERQHVIDAKIKLLFDKRIDYMSTHVKIADVLKGYGNEHITYIESKFWDIFNVISKTFITEGIYNLSNYSIRYILLSYCNFIYYALQNTTIEKNILSLIKNKSDHSKLTTLRNHFYKWIICGDSFRPLQKNTINIFDEQHGHILGPSLTILETLYNLQEKETMPDISLAYLYDNLSYIGMSEDDFNKYIKKINDLKPTYKGELIFIDNSNNDLLHGSNTIELMPSGIYFIDKLSVSREYVFWSILTADIEVPLIDNMPKYNETYRDEFKYSIIYNYLDKYYLNRFIAYINHIKNAIRFPIFKGEADILKHYKYKFAKDKFYLERLIESLLETISHAYMPNQQKTEFTNKFNEIRNKYKNIIN